MGQINKIFGDEASIVYSQSFNDGENSSLGDIQTVDFTHKEEKIYIGTASKIIY
jgi:hypothetical protein